MSVQPVQSSPALYQTETPESQQAPEKATKASPIPQDRVTISSSARVSVSVSTHNTHVVSNEDTHTE